MADLLLREAPIRPTSFDAATRTVEAVIATSTPVRRRDGRGGEYLEVLNVRGANLARFTGAPVLIGHRADPSNVIGVVTGARLEGEQIIASVQFSERTEFAPIIRDIESGVLRNVSVGYSVEKWKE